MYPGQPLLRLKQSHNPHNLLGAEGLLSCTLGALFYIFPHPMRYVIFSRNVSFLSLMNPN